MAFDREAAKKAGYTDEEIDAYLRANPSASKEAPANENVVDSLPPPTTEVPDIDRTNETLATGAGAVGPALLEAAPYAIYGYGAYKGHQYLNAGLDALQGYNQRTAVTEFNTLMNNYSKMNHDIRQYQKAGQPVPQSLLDSQAKLGQQIEAAQSRISTTPQAEPARGAVRPQAQAPAPAPAPAQPPARPAPAPGPTQAMGAVAPEAQAATQAARTAAPAAAQSGNIMSRVAPYLQAAGKVAAPVARVAGPAGAAITAYETYPYLQQAEVGARTASGEVGKMVRGANRMALNMPTPAPLSPQEARNLLASGDERTINIYGGRAKLQAIANPNALNSGYAQELNRLGR